MPRWQGWGLVCPKTVMDQPLLRAWHFLLFNRNFCRLRYPIPWHMLSVWVADASFCSSWVFTLRVITDLDRRDALRAASSKPRPDVEVKILTFSLSLMHNTKTFSSLGRGWVDLACGQREGLSGFKTSPHVLCLPPEAGQEQTHLLPLERGLPGALLLMERM